MTPSLYIRGAGDLRRATLSLSNLYILTRDRLLEQDIDSEKVDSASIHRIYILIRDRPFTLDIDSEKAAVPVFTGCSRYFLSRGLHIHFYIYLFCLIIDKMEAFISLQDETSERLGTYHSVSNKDNTIIFLQAFLAILDHRR